jgi:hypothetical protein
MSLSQESRLRRGRPKWPRSPLTERHRELLDVLAIAPHGSDVNALLTRGFKLETMADLVRAKLAAVRIEIVENRTSKVEIALVQITDAGWRALRPEGLDKPVMPTDAQE